MSCTTGVICDPRFKAHDTGPHHPETARRIDAVLHGLQPLIDRQAVTLIPPTPANLHDITRCHSEQYVHLVEHEVHLHLPELSTGDTLICPATWDTALLAAGACVQAVDLVVTGKLRNCFVAPRPPGHHATRDRGMGFCVFNNIAVAARHAQEAHGLERILIADWDVHHGNGTQDIFYHDPTVLFFSTHQAGLFPPWSGWTSERGEGPGEGYTINRPLPPGAGRAEVFDAFENDLAPAVASFKPDLVLISAGFDSRIDDPLGDLRLTDEDFAGLTRFMLAIADDHCSGRLVSILEGGYSLSGLASATAAHVGAMVDEA